MRSSLAVLAVMPTVPIVLLLAGCMATSARAAEDPRDFTGVWQAFASDPAITKLIETRHYTPEGEIKLADFSQRYPNLLEPAAWCVPAGMPSTMLSLAGNVIEITQSPTRLTLLAALNNQYRRLYLDEREWPEDPAPSPMGYSIARWDANTLVIETRSLDEMLASPFPRTTYTVVVERVSKTTRDQVTAAADPAITTASIDDSVLAFNLTITDATLYTKPQSVTVYYQHVDEQALQQDNCATALWQQALDDANP